MAQQSLRSALYSWMETQRTQRNTMTLNGCLRRCTPRALIRYVYAICSFSRSSSLVKTLTMASLFLLAMVLNPRVFKKAQQEIDSVVGNQRLPSFSDRPSLPYVEAVMSETFRWGCPVPLSRFNLSRRIHE